MNRKAGIVLLAVLVLGGGILTLGIRTWDSYVDQQQKEQRDEAYEDLDLDYLEHRKNFLLTCFKM
ncbi:hypothetical protein [Natranaerobius thermophilus]|uniref:Uncharacterized protein n=1 Tax=Natranaerobius thermophilus (strain ATCC BAA-1301 / DSM 18059 / JW/NM-WN-LF) TaxID=457570 RepID=B2A7B3_NATTJ|nr:hypothetical protein [Natranaerobius thermophilus]ACB84307.1 hypothetical protein Nther_0716 [Natranaerobius thermophilus JW/NM-WN-LF]